MRELDEIGLSAMWLGVAAFLGYDRFMQLWRHLSADARVLTEDNQIVIHLRDFGWYERMQRDLFIRRMAASGFRPAEIHLQLRAQFGDHTTSRKMVNQVASERWAGNRMVAKHAHRLSLYMQQRMRDAAAQACSQDLFPRDLERAIVAEAARSPMPVRGQARDRADMAEMIDIGLQGAWLDVVRLIGYDDFVTLWRAWSSDPSLRKASGLIELRLRSARAFDRYQRNRYIETLVHAGFKPSEIYTMLRKDLGEELSQRQLLRLVRAAKVPV